MSISTEKLIFLRKERGWSQEKLAAMSGVSERTIQRAEGEGVCSLDTKMALASSLEVPPSHLHPEAEVLNVPKVKFITSWSGAFGLFVLGLIAPIVVLLTATSGKWEIAWMVLVWGLTICLTIMSYGIKATYRLFDSTSWLVKYPNHVSGLNSYIVQAKTTIEYSYIVGVVASLVCALTIAVHAPVETNNTTSYISYAVRPIIYSILFVELWFRPFKRRLEAMLLAQRTDSQT